MTKARISKTRLAVTVCLIVLSAILFITSAVGFAFRHTDATETRLGEMRTNAVLHAASGGIVDSIAADANAAKLKELRALKTFRQMGMNEVKALCLEAESAARAEAEKLYGGVVNADVSELVTDIEAMSAALKAYQARDDIERQTYEDIYNELILSVPDWTDFVGDLDDESLIQQILALVPSIGIDENAHLAGAMARAARAMSMAEEKKDDEQTYALLMSGLNAAVADWTQLEDCTTDDEALWTRLSDVYPTLADSERFRDAILKDARERVESALKGETAEETAQELSEISEEQAQTDFTYFTESPTLQALGVDVDGAYSDLWAELTVIIPDLSGLNRKMQNAIREDIERVVYSENLNFSERFDIYTEQKADEILQGSDAFIMRLSAMAGQTLIAAIALALFAIAYTFWKSLTHKLGVPRTIITLFFIYLCLAAELYNINVPMMMGNVFKRVGMYGVLVLAMLPGIQCGIGLNMGMTIGCISGLLSTVIALQYNLTGFPALIFACVIGLIIAIPLGWAYSKLLNRMKGNEMTISTYVGFSFVSLMCIGWMLLPFDNPKIIWLLSGRGLRVTHSLLGSFAHLLDDWFAFDLFEARIPTGLILFFLACCGAMWLFSRSRTGVAMTAAGSNPRFAEASGINVNHMRTVGTILSTMIAAVGIVIYSQAFGYAQLYTAPRQLGFIAASAILIGGATVSKAKVGHVIIGVFLFEGVLALGQQIANAAVAGGGLSEVMRIMISNGIILYALTQSGGASRD